MKMDSIDHSEFNTPPIPSDIVFPLELSRYLKGQLSISIEENWHLKKFIQAQENELKTLRQRQKPQTPPLQQNIKEGKFGWKSTGAKIIDLKKSRNSKCVEMDNIRSRVKQLKGENGDLRKRVKDLETELEKQKSVDKEKDIMNSSQLLTQTTNKVMEYRHKYQMAQVDLKNALKALSQEVGDGATPQTVLSITNSNSWRGRQQLIIGLQLRISELQAKHAYTLQQQSKNTSNCGNSVEGGGDCSTSTGGNGNNNSECFEDQDFLSGPIHSPSGQSSVSHWQVSCLQKQERKKQSQLEKAQQDLEEIKKELQLAQEKLRGSKARVQTLETQLRTSRFYGEELDAKLKEKDHFIQQSNEELTLIHRELSITKEREKTLRERNSEELGESKQNLAKERLMVKNLEKILEEKIETVKDLDEKNFELRTKLNFYKENPGSSDTYDILVRDLRFQLTHTEEMLEESENKYQELFKKMQVIVSQLEDERLSHTETQEKLLKALTILKKADECIVNSLDVGQVVNPDILKEVELVRQLVREINTGDQLISLDVSSNDVTKLKMKINLLTNEITMLKESLKETSEERRRDILTFSQFAERSRRIQSKEVLNLNHN